jgi:hypothetical protein
MSSPYIGRAELFKNLILSFHFASFPPLVHIQISNGGILKSCRVIVPISVYHMHYTLSPHHSFKNIFMHIVPLFTLYKLIFTAFYLFQGVFATNYFTNYIFTLAKVFKFIQLIMFCKKNILNLSITLNSIIK